MYKLKSSLPFLNGHLTHMRWYFLNYPVSNEIYFGLAKTDGGNEVVTGNYHVPQNVIDSWGIDDSVITTHLEEQKPWETK